MHEYTNDTNEEKILYKELSFKVIAACFEVHNILGPGYSERIYEEAVSKELRDRGIGYERQKLVEVHYKGEKIGEYRLDLVIEGKIIMEIKAASELNSVFEAQILSYLKATEMRLGIPVNFGGREVTYKRIVN